MNEANDIELGRAFAGNLFALPDMLSVNATVQDLLISAGLSDAPIVFQKVFGVPLPSDAELLLIHLHASARDEQIERLIDDKEKSKSLCEVGKLAITTATAIAVYEQADNLATGQELDAKVSFICTSHAVLRTLHEMGFCRAVVGRGMLSPALGNERGVFSVCQEVAHRYAGHLFLTRPWDDFLGSFRAILDVRNRFPYTSYVEANSKSLLQHWLQQSLESTPRYDVVGETGPDHNKNFKVEVWSGKTGNKRLGEGEGRTVKEAEIAAACNALATVAKPYGAETRQSHFDAAPEWLLTRCESIGKHVLAEVTDRPLSTGFRQAVLIPRCKHAQLQSHLLRERLAVVGSRVRQLMAFRHAVMNRGTFSDAKALVNCVNNNGILCELVNKSPLGKWISALRSSDMFAQIDQKGPLIDTLNTLLGALVIEHGFMGAKSVETLLFAGREATVATTGSARSKLQQAIQEVVKDKFAHLFEIKVAMLHQPHEAHRARVEVTVYFDGVELGRAEASNKKEASELAAGKALVNPLLRETLAKHREA